MPESPSQHAPQTARWWLSIVSSLAAALGVAAIWAALSVALHSTVAWMALLAALDVIGVLALTGLAASRARAVLAGLATTLSLALAWWFIAAAQMARAMGLHPFVSLQRMGSSLALDLVRSSHTSADLTWAIASVLLAMAWGRHGTPAWLNARRRPP